MFLVQGCSDKLRIKDYIGVISGLYWGYIGVILGLHGGYMGIMEKKMEITILYTRVYIRF